MKEKTCFFIGHRDTSESIYPIILKAVRTHITEYGVTRFIVGRYGDFDKLAAKAVAESKKEHPEIMLTLLLAYHPAEKKPEKPRGVR